MKYEVQENCLTIFLPGELDHHNAEEIRKRSDYLIDQNHIRYVIFDFTDTTFMDSSGIGMMIGRCKNMDFTGGEVRAEHMNGRIRKIFLLSGLHKMVKIEEGGEEE